MHDLREDGKRDLLRRFGPNGQTDGRTELLHPRRVQPGFGQLTAHQSRAAPAAHHADIGGGLLQNGRQTLDIAAVGAGNDHKIALCSAGDCCKALFKGQAEHRVGPGLPQLPGKFRAVL